jgi:transposase
VQLGPANEHDSKRFEELLDSVHPVRGQRGPPRKRPTKLHADKGYDFPRCQRACRDRGIAPRIARRGVESSERLGRYCWVVERTLAWLHRFRRLAVRYERRSDIHRAFLSSRVRADLVQVRGEVLLGALSLYVPNTIGFAIPARVNAVTATQPGPAYGSFDHRLEHIIKAIQDGRFAVSLIALVSPSETIKHRLDSQLQALDLDSDALIALPVWQMTQEAREWTIRNTPLLQ